MAYDYDGKTWHIKGVDSVDLRSYEICAHKPNNEDYITLRLQGTDYIKCKNCGRNFQLIHPVIAEQIIRDKDEEIQWLKERINNV